MKIVMILFVLILLYVVYEAIRIYPLFQNTTSLIKNTLPYEKTDGKLSLLVVGDSTGVGVGAASISDSIAGQLSRYLNSSVENYAVSGAVIADVPLQLSHAKKKLYDVMLIQIGANDVTHLTAPNKVEDILSTILKTAKTKSHHVIVMTSGKVGDAPFIPIIFKSLFNTRFLAIRELFIKVVKGQNAIYIDLLPISDTFNTDTGRYYASDYFHPSSDGYALWFSVLKQTITPLWPELIHGAESSH